MKVTVYYIMNACSMKERKGNTLQVFPERDGWAAVCGSRDVFEALKPQGEVVDHEFRALRFGGNDTQDAILAVLRQAFDVIEEFNTPPWEVVRANLN